MVQGHLDNCGVSADDIYDGGMLKELLEIGFNRGVKGSFPPRAQDADDDFWTFVVPGSNGLFIIVLNCTFSRAAWLNGGIWEF